MIKPPGEQAKTMRTTVELYHIDSRWSDGVLQMGGAILYTWIAGKIEIPRHQNEQIWFFSTKNSTLSFKQAFSWTWIHLRTTKQKRSAKEFLAFLTLCTHTPLSGYDPHCHRWWLYSTAYVKFSTTAIPTEEQSQQRPTLPLTRSSECFHGPHAQNNHVAHSWWLKFFWRQTALLKSWKLPAFSSHIH